MKLKNQLVVYLLLLGFTTNTLAVFFFGSTTYNKISIILFAILSYQLVVKRGTSTLQRFTGIGFAILFFFNSCKNGFHITNLYDIAQIGSTALFIYTLASNPQKITNKSFVLITFIIAFALYSPVFFGIDRGQNISTPSMEADDIESARRYYSGLFETPQVVAYVFFYLCIAAYCLFKKRRFSISTTPWQIIFALSSFVVIFSGSRAPIYGLIISICLYAFLLSGKKLSYGLLAASILCALYLGFDILLKILRDTILFQYLSFAQTATSNAERLSRVMIWSIFLEQVQNFTMIDVLLGRGFHASLDTIEASLGLRIWFHNDFLSIFYSYGLAGSALYLLPFFFLYRRYRATIRANPSAFVAFFSLIFFAFTNGLYYYYAPLLLLLMEFVIKQKINAVHPATIKQNKDRRKKRYAYLQT